MFACFRWYRRWRGGLWQYNPQWGWIRYEEPKPPPPDEDYR